jgi:hypothetical protein
MPLPRQLMSLHQSESMIVCLLARKHTQSHGFSKFRILRNRTFASCRAPIGHLSRVPPACGPGSTVPNHARRSIVVRPASGFLLVSLSKVPRPQLFNSPPTVSAEALPIKANDKAFFIRAALLTIGDYALLWMASEATIVQSGSHSGNGLPHALGKTLQCSGAHRLRPRKRPPYRRT